MPDKHQPTLGELEINQAFKKLEVLLSSTKARECIRKAEDALAFDVELFIQPIRQDLADCMELVADLIRERGTTSHQIQTLLPVLSKYLDPAHYLAGEVARLEREITDKKRKHPDFILAAKLTMLLQKYEQHLQSDKLDSIEYTRVFKQVEITKRTLAEHLQKKIRLAQRAFAPDMLELAQFQLELARHQEKILAIKGQLLDELQNQSRGTLQHLAKIFEEADPALADTILAQTQALVSTGNATELPHQKKVPSTLEEFKQELQAQQARLTQYEELQTICRDQLQTLIQFEEAIFNTYGDQLRSKNISFKKSLAPEKSGVGSHTPTFKKASRMVRRNS
jgi:hypothetical protein